MKERILYVLHIDWNWIKQRPQYLAEELSDYYDITCVYPFSWNFKKKRKNKAQNVKLIPVLQLPFNKYRLISMLNKRMMDICIRFLCSVHRYSEVILPYPMLYNEWMKKVSVIYDCMDNYRAFLNQEKRRAFGEKGSALVKNASIVFCSSQYIKTDLMATYECLEEKIRIVRNGYSPEIKESVMSKPGSDKFKICYFGTIASWFDFESVTYCLEKANNLEFHLAGPIDNVEIPNAEGLIYDGVVRHEQLGDYVAGFDALIMPFIVNDIIKAVDPVKLYEYVNFNKNILCVRYDEILRFDEFVHFYDSKEELFLEITSLMESNILKYTNQQRVRFLMNNTWQCRTKQIHDIIVDFPGLH